MHQDRLRRGPDRLAETVTAVRLGTPSVSRQASWQAPVKDCNPVAQQLLTVAQPAGATGPCTGAGHSLPTGLQAVPQRHCSCYCVATQPPDGRAAGLCRQRPGQWYVSRSTGTARWLDGTLGKGWSASGDKLASLHALGRQASLKGQMFDLRGGRRWQPEAVVEPAGRRSVQCFGSAQSSACETLAAAAYLAAPKAGKPEYFVAVFSAKGERARIGPFSGPHHQHVFAWLPNSPTLVVWHSGSLALFELGPSTSAPARTLKSERVQAREMCMPGSHLRLAVLPGGQAIVTLHCTSSLTHSASTNRGQAVYELALYSSADLRQLSHKSLGSAVPYGYLGQYLPSSLQASQRAVAAAFEEAGTSVYRIDQACSVQRRLYEVKHLQHPAFDVSGRLLAGSVHNKLVVLDALTGTSFVRLAPADWFPGLMDAMLQPLSIAWDAQHRPQLHVVAEVTGRKPGPSVLLTTLAFE